jgi:hypothetical protein
MVAVHTNGHIAGNANEATLITEEIDEWISDTVHNLA